MRRSIKGKSEEKAKSDESENGDISDEAVVTPTLASSGSKPKRRSKGKVSGPRSKRRKVEEEEDDAESKASLDKDEGSNSEDEEQDAATPKKNKMGGKGKKPADSNEEDEDKTDESGDEELPLSKKMKAVKKVSAAKNGLTKGKRRAAELEEKVEYEVESVVGCRLQRGKRQFRIRWKGFKEEDDTWENEDSLDCAEAIEKYLRDHPEDDTRAKGPKSVKSSKKGDNRSKTANKEKNGQDANESEEVSKEEYEVEQIKDVFIKKNGKREFLIRWKGYASKDDTWEPEEHLNCGDLIKKYEEKLDKAKSLSAKELRISRKPTDRFTLTMVSQGRRVSRRGGGKQRVRYDDAE